MSLLPRFLTLIALLLRLAVEYLNDDLLSLSAIYGVNLPRSYLEGVPAAYNHSV